MTVHYFHCTDGVDLIIDRTGRDGSNTGDLLRRARDVADELRRAVPTFHEWQGWSVHVYDERGEVAIVPFDPKDAPLRHKGGAL
ncbi:hypothetical protein [Enterovirga sp.]|jgi:hypothetical protein|uniref:DUF6894 family protein n=1 Tax=Enterovirga sp. TaxID=2026350 RepID=UPI00261763A9|nr:hypothetical protein [Enterovirga sp.]MDB5592610.1 hypothetical protein [Enterovirga sp.]